MSSKKPGESESESGSEHMKELTSESDVIGLDIFDDALWDTDLNSESKVLHFYLLFQNCNS